MVWAFGEALRYTTEENEAGVEAWLALGDTVFAEGFSRVLCRLLHTAAIPQRVKLFRLVLSCTHPEFEAQLRAVLARGLKDKSVQVRTMCTVFARTLNVLGPHGGLTPDP